MAISATFIKKTKEGTMIHIDENKTEIRGSMVDVMVDLTTVMHHMLNCGCGLEPKDLHEAVDLATMSKEEAKKEADRLRGIHQMVSDAFVAARKD
jgi:hypothetical protein